ncbi:MAG: SDR family oxidoreductase [Alphaproteobacteria bacterium]|nr:SDR family oxidoreductase [Alphaproteobacteria bacterium]
MALRLAGKVALVTGGTSGIGAATVKRFVEDGARVAIVGRNAEAGATLVRNLGGQACFIKADVSQESEIVRVLNEAVGWGGRLDVLFNNAGGLAPGGVDTFTAEDFDYAVRLVLGSVLYGIKYASPIMKAQRWGAIINNSSIGALRTHMGGYLYSVAKAGVSHATRLAGMELGRFNITVNCVSPGAVTTPLFLGGSRVAAHMQPEKAKAVMAKVADGLAQATPLARSGSAEDVASAVSFLASDEGHYINCHDLVIDGGLTAAGRSSFAADDPSDPLAMGRRAMR